MTHSLAWRTGRPATRSSWPARWPSSPGRRASTTAPWPDGPEFKADVTAIAAAFGIDPTKLARAVRYGEGLARLRESARAAGEPSHLLAARDGEPEPPGEPP